MHALFSCHIASILLHFSNTALEFSLYIINNRCNPIATAQLIEFDEVHPILPSASVTFLVAWGFAPAQAILHSVQRASTSLQLPMGPCIVSRKVSGWWECVRSHGSGLVRPQEAEAVCRFLLPLCASLQGPSLTVNRASLSMSSKDIVCSLQTKLDQIRLVSDFRCAVAANTGTHSLLERWKVNIGMVWGKVWP